MLAALLLPTVGATTYPLVDSFAGDTFLNGWTYPTSAYDNTTSGDVFWATPDNTSLIYTNDAGRVILKVDNTTLVPYNDKRYAPNLMTKRAYPPGTVWVMDAVHMPYGCSVWPALWTQGADWPAGGEIDIMEGVNMQTKNQIALHADGSGCMASTDVQMTGALNLNNCSGTANFGSGCTVADPSTNSYGADFAAAGGGVYVAEFAPEYIKVWFITRSAVPSALTADAKEIDTGSLGEPTAYYPATTCDIEKYFGDQTLTIDITLCGTWAGAQDTLEATCPQLVGTNSCYTTYVINDASATYANAYFELNYINVYSNSTSLADDNSTTSSGSNASGSGSGTGSQPSATGTSAASRGMVGAGVMAAAVMAGVAMVL